MSQGLHEDYRRSPPARGSNRAFGFVVAVSVPLLVGIFARPWLGAALGVGATFAAVATVRPRWLEGPNRAWHTLGVLLGRVVTPVVMGVLFYLVITPFGLVQRLVGKDRLGLEFDADATSYWIEREPPGPEPADLPRQY